MRKVAASWRVAVWFCLLLVLLAAVTPNAANFSLIIFTIFWFFVVQVLVALLPSVSDQVDLLYVPALPAFSPRPPPEL